MNFPLERTYYTSSFFKNCIIQAVIWMDGVHNRKNANKVFMAKPQQKRLRKRNEYCNENATNFPT